MKKIEFLLVILTACCPKHYPPTVVYRDSVRVEVHERIVHDTVSFEVPVIVEKNVTRDTVSRLENAWAKSDATLQDGFLWHTLETKGQTVYIPITTIVHDTVTVEKEAEILKDTVTVVKALTPRQERLIRRGKAATWAVVLLCVGALAALVLKLLGKWPFG